MQNKVSGRWILLHLLMEIVLYIPKSIYYFTCDLISDIRGVDGDVHSPIGFHGTNESEILKKDHKNGSFKRTKKRKRL